VVKAQKKIQSEGENYFTERKRTLRYIHLRIFYLEVRIIS